MLSYLFPKDGPVFEGLEDREVIYAEDQPEYLPLRTLVSNCGNRRVISRWTLTPEQRTAIANGGDLYLELLTFGEPLQPIRLSVDDGQPMDMDWVRLCLLGEPVDAAEPVKSEPIIVELEPVEPTAVKEG